MWVVIHMAKGEEAAKAVEVLLQSEGVLVKRKQVYKNLPPDENYYEIQVPGAEAKEARDLLIENSI